MQLIFRLKAEAAGAEGSGNLSAVSDNHCRMSGMPAADASDGDLVRRAAGGEREAFAAIYARYHSRVYRFARMMSGATSVAEDVTQDVFIALMRDLPRYRPQRALGTYLYGIARNLVRNRLRREGRFVALDTAAPEPAAPDDPCAVLARSRDVARLRRAIADLPSRYREAIILADIHGLSYAETAVVVGAPVGTVRSRLNRGRSLIATRLREQERAGQAGRTAVRCVV
jgi:RNA polymerase sigma-70 factor (ECF subfamily)